MVITGIERQKRNPRRVNVYLDGAFAFGLHEEVLLKLGLHTGDAVDEHAVRRIEQQEEVKLAYDRALRLVGIRMRGENELRTRLAQKDFSPEAIDAVILRMQESGLVNDTSFARAYIHDQMARKPAGRAFFQYQLKRKGIDPEIIRSVLESQFEGENEQERALAAATAILARYQTSRKQVDARKQQQRLAGFLARRGFTSSTIRSVIQTLFSPTHSRPAEE